MAAATKIADPEKVSKLLIRLAAPDSIAQLDANPVNLARFAKILLANNKQNAAVDLAHRVMWRAPENAEAAEIAAQVLRHAVPAWHQSILQDQARIDAFEQALRRNIVKGMHVLEIGAGTGILAMMAARAGASEVTSCEAHRAVAGAAKEIVRLNGYLERVKIVAKHSRELTVGQDLERPADLLVAEIISSDMIGEGILDSIADACGRLVRRGARVIPARGSIRICLAHDAKLAERQVGSVNGFDLSPLNKLMGPLALATNDQFLGLRSDPWDIFAFDFESGGPFDNRQSSSCLTSTGGPVNGIAQWIKLELDSKADYENRPAPGVKSSWAVQFFPFTKPINTEPGECFIVEARRDDRSIWLWSQRQP